MTDFSPYNAYQRTLQSNQQLVSSVARFGAAFMQAERISQYSKGVAARDEAKSKYNQSLFDRTWPDPIGTGPDKRRLGELTQEEIAKDHDLMVGAQRTWILQNVTNRQAKEQLLQELEPWAASNYTQVLDTYRSQRMIEMVDNSDRMIKMYQENTSLSLQGKIDAINAQYDRDVAGRIRWANDAALEKAKRKEEVQATYAMAGALDAAKAEGWDMKAADKWIEENTHFWDTDPNQKVALRNLVESRVDSYRREELRLNEAHDDGVDITLTETYRKAVDSIEGLRTMRNSVTDKTFTLAGRSKRWVDDITYRLNYLEQRAESGGGRGVDLDSQDDKRIMTEWLLIQDAMQGSRPLTFTPSYGPTVAKTLIPGSIPSSDDAKAYLLHNYGAYFTADGAATPRLRTTYVESAMKEIGAEIVPNLRDATAVLWAATKVTKAQPRPTLTQAEAGDMAAALRTGFYEGRLAEADLPDIAARWAFNRAIEKAVSSNLPLAQAALGGVVTTDTTEKYLNDVANHWFSEWRDRPDAGALETIMDQQANQMMSRVEEYTGKAPTKYWIQSDGEVWVWYANPAAPNDDRRGELYRFKAITIGADHLYADAAPKLQVFAEGAGDWQTPEDQRPFAQRKGAGAAKPTAAETAVAQQQKETALLGQYEQRAAGLGTAWYEKGTANRITNPALVQQLDRLSAGLTAQQKSARATLQGYTQREEGLNRIWVDTTGRQVTSAEIIRRLDEALRLSK